MPLQPPPRLTGDKDAFIVELHEWVWGLFKALDIEGEYALSTAVDALESDKVDPAAATAATAQETANAALTLAESNDARIDPLETGEAGQFTVSGTDTTAAVTFGTPQADTSYYIAFGGDAITGSPAADAYIITGITKTENGFTAQLRAAPGASNSVIFGWVLKR